MNDPGTPLEIYDGTAELTREICDVKMLHAKYFGPGKPFYWVAPADDGCAATGWYQWTESGLQYLGASILERSR